MIPLISSICYGPLGVCQLPRLWWKVLLRKAGLLDPDYPDCSGGLDTWVLEKLDLGKEATLTYLRNEMPTYLDFEVWVLDRKGGKLDKETVEAWNAFIRTRIHREQKRIEIHATVGRPDDGTLTSAVVLNHIEDWHLLYRRDLNGSFSELNGRVVPLISSIDYGPLGVCQLPRTWLKVLLKARGVLHPDYPDCGGGLDARVLAVLNLDREATLSYLRTEMPTYLDFETWVREQVGGRIDRAAVEEWNQSIRERIHNEQKRREIHVTVGRHDNGTL
ncbi:MAG: hypothetical protein HY709_03155, partial [Candidatus Latescibacteria bacterium]|nr:hypothetical protein [Candidatus Latescibacterota bacterium]